MPTNLPVYDAVGLSHMMEEGTTVPLVLDCVDRSSGELVPIFTKYIQVGRVTEDNLFRELVSTLFARMLGVRTAAPSLVDVSDEAAEIINRQIEDEHSGTTRILPGMAFGCSHLDNLLPMDWPANLKTMVRMTDARRIFAADLCFQNIDRIPDNPNCGYHGNGIVAYDFEYCLDVHPGMPMGLAYEVAEHHRGPDHVFYDTLKGVVHDWSDVVTWAAFNDQAAITEIIGSAPVRWHGRAKDVEDFMLELASGATELPDQLSWSLA